jgi:hypothetical protein
MKGRRRISREEEARVKYLMTRRITHLIEEHENRSKLFNTRDPDIEATRTLEDP